MRVRDDVVWGLPTRERGDRTSTGHLDGSASTGSPIGTRRRCPAASCNGSRSRPRSPAQPSPADLRRVDRDDRRGARRGAARAATLAADDESMSVVHVTPPLSQRERRSPTAFIALDAGCGVERPDAPAPRCARAPVAARRPPLLLLRGVGTCTRGTPWAHRALTTSTCASHRGQGQCSSSATTVRASPRWRGSSRALDPSEGEARLDGYPLRAESATVCGRRSRRPRLQLLRPTVLAEVSARAGAETRGPGARRRADSTPIRRSRPSASTS